MTRHCCVNNNKQWFLTTSRKGLWSKEVYQRVSEQKLVISEEVADEN